MAPPPTIALPPPRRPQEIYQAALEQLQLESDTGRLTPSKQLRSAGNSRAASPLRRKSSAGHTFAPVPLLASVPSSPRHGSILHSQPGLGKHPALRDGILRQSDEQPLQAQALAQAQAQHQLLLLQQHQQQHQHPMLQQHHPQQLPHHQAADAAACGEGGRHSSLAGAYPAGLTGGGGSSSGVSTPRSYTQPSPRGMLQPSPSPLQRVSDRGGGLLAQTVPDSPNFRQRSSSFTAGVTSGGAAPLGHPLQLQLLRDQQQPGAAHGLLGMGPPPSRPGGPLRPQAPAGYSALALDVGGGGHGDASYGGDRGLLREEFPDSPCSVSSTVVSRPPSPPPARATRLRRVAA
jgi:hypothetical protein